jgi:hypothetical protein
MLIVYITSCYVECQQESEKEDLSIYGKHCPEPNGRSLRLTRLSSPSSSRPQASVTQMPKGHLGGPLEFRLR